MNRKSNGNCQEFSLHTYHLYDLFARFGKIDKPVMGMCRNFDAKADFQKSQPRKRTFWSAAACRRFCVR